MKVTQKSLALIDHLCLIQIPFGQTIKMEDYDGYVMRVKPTQFLLNSNIVGDMIARGDCFVVDLETGVLFATKGNRPVVRVHAETIVHG